MPNETVDTKNAHHTGDDRFYENLRMDRDGTHQWGTKLQWAHDMPPSMGVPFRYLLAQIESRLNRIENIQFSLDKVVGGQYGLALESGPVTLVGRSISPDGKVPMATVKYADGTFDDVPMRLLQTPRGVTSDPLVRIPDGTRLMLPKGATMEWRGLLGSYDRE